MYKMAVDKLNLESIVNYLGGGILCCKNNSVLTIVYASSSFYKMIGYEDGEITALFDYNQNLVLGNSPPIDWRRLAVSLKKSNFIELELKLIKKDGHHIWTNCHMRLMTEEDGTEYFCGIMSDITLKRRLRKEQREQLKAIKRTERELAASEERYRIIMEQAADPICDYNFKTQELYCSPPFKEKFGIDVGVDGLLEQLYHSDLVYSDDKSHFMSDLYGIIDGTSAKNPEYRFKNMDGNYRWYRVRCTVIRDKKGEPLRMIAFITDIDKQKKENMSLKEKAEHDLLTGLYNRMTTIALIDKAISQSSGSSHALLVIDIDNFKNVNDSHGHLAGDEVIVDISTKIKNQFREGDIIGRIGGDEFVVFLKDIPLLGVKKKCEILQGLFHSVHPKDDQYYKVSGSVGVAVYPRDGKSYRELFLKADTAMYAAKGEGKDAYCMYSEELKNVGHDIEKYDHRI